MLISGFYRAKIAVWTETIASNLRQYWSKNGFVDVAMIVDTNAVAREATGERAARIPEQRAQLSSARMLPLQAKILTSR